MPDDSIVAEAETMTFWARHRFFVLVFVTILTALTMTVVSLVMYNVSGSAQLDLSRPGYQSVSGQVEREDKTEVFSASGPVTLETIEEFMSLYKADSDRAKAVDAFNGDPLNPETLEFIDSSATPQVE
jgi:hypothetical protein